MAVSTHRQHSDSQWPGLFRSIAHAFGRSNAQQNALDGVTVSAASDASTLAALTQLRADVVAEAAPLGFRVWRAVVLSYGEGSARKMQRERASLEALGERVSVGDYDRLQISGLLLTDADRSTILSASSLTAKLWSRTAAGWTLLSSAITAGGAQRWNSHLGSDFAQAPGQKVTINDAKLIRHEAVQSLHGAWSAHKALVEILAARGDGRIAPLSFDDYAQMLNCERRAR